jgi:antirestriction protein ArdC
MDIAQTITDRIIAELEQGTAPWVKPWDENCESYNPISGTVYRGMNQLWLSMMAWADPMLGSRSNKLAMQA